VTELFSGKSSVRDGISDPCDATNFQSGNDPATREANCRTALAAIDPTLTPENFHSTTDTLSATGYISGNLNLENETSNSWSVGFVYQPAWLPRFRISADWSDIKLRNAIRSLSIQDALDACYDNPNYPNTPQCQSFTRIGTTPPAGRVEGDIANGYLTGYQNTASIDYAGLIAAAEYSFDLNQLNANWDNWGGVKLSAKLVYNDKYEFTAAAGQLPVNSVGGAGLPRVSGQFNATYTRGPLDLNAQAVWVSATKNFPNDPDNYIDPHYNNISAYVKFNAAIGYQLTPFAHAQISIQNLFDKQLSDAQLLSRAYSTYDLIGRRYVFSLTTTF
jgi:outer membrane receptor protein involved in Fe transport